MGVRHQAVTFRRTPRISASTGVSYSTTDLTESESCSLFRFPPTEKVSEVLLTSPSLPWPVLSCPELSCHSVRSLPWNVPVDGPSTPYSFLTPTRLLHSLKLFSTEEKGDAVYALRWRWPSVQSSCCAVREHMSTTSF